MIRYIALILTGTAVGLLAMQSCHSGKNNQKDNPLQSMAGVDSAVVKNYVTYCGSCHGEHMDAFVDRQWKFGSSKDDLVKGIKEGYPDVGMPAFGTSLSDTEIKALADYILKGIDHVKTYSFETKTAVNEFETEKFTYQLDTIATGAGVPWGIAFLPGNELLVTDRGGKLFKIGADRNKILVTGLPEVNAQNQGGLMDVILHPDFENNKLIYLTYSKLQRSGGRTLSTTAVMRAKLIGNALAEQKDIFEAQPYLPTHHHYGSRMAFGPDGNLYFSVGERGRENEFPQKMDNDLGKIHRIKDDGSIPEDNPFLNTPDAKKTIYSYGHRNPQGLAFKPGTNELWSHEHGPRGGDEINLVVAGKNYGWPVTTFGINYNGSVISEKSTAPGIEAPVWYWLPSIGPSGMAFVTGSHYPGWEGAILTGALRFQYLNLSHLQGKNVVKEEKLLPNIGRLREVRISPDNYIYVGVETGHVFKLVPVAK